jgi:hypothetical protein
MPMKLQHERPKPGDVVVLTNIPQGLLESLPSEDQQAITDAVKKPMLLNEYDAEGRAVLEFTDVHEVIHFIYVHPSLVQIAKRK